jgi:lupus La protein
LKEIELDGNKLEITYKPKYHEMKAEQYKDSTSQKPKKFGFNAFKNQHFHSNNKRKSSGGFGRNNNKKTKTDEVVEEKKEAPAAEEEKNE